MSDALLVQSVIIALYFNLVSLIILKKFTYINIRTFLDKPLYFYF
jgi:hypothetical protein